MLFNKEKKIGASNTNYYMTSEGYYKCNFKNCELVSKSKSSIQVHTLIHIGERHFACTFDGCTKKFFCQGNLNYHMNSHKSAKKETSIESGLNCVFEIEKRKKKQERQEFLCKFNKCRKVFPDRESFAAHKLEHANKKYYKCYVKDCKHSYRQPSSLKKHLRIHFNSEMDGFKCCHCPVSFSKFTTLLVHLRSHDDNGALHKKRIFECKSSENDEQLTFSKLSSSPTSKNDECSTQDNADIQSSNLTLSDDNTMPSQDYFDFFANFKSTLLYYQSHYDIYKIANKPTIEDSMAKLFSTFSSKETL